MIILFFFQSDLSHDPVVTVRVAYAENIALLAETALRFAICWVTFILVFLYILGLPQNMKEIWK